MRVSSWSHSTDASSLPARSKAVTAAFTATRTWPASTQASTWGPTWGCAGFTGAAPAARRTDEFASAFQPIAFYGGELNLRFGSSAPGARRFTPYGIVGGGYVDALSDYPDELNGGLGRPDDRYFATLGGGLEVPLSKNIKLQGDVRSLFMSSQEAEDVSDPDEVQANLMYSAGIQFSLGGRGGPGDLLDERERRLREETRADLNETEQALLAEIQRLQKRVESLQRREELEEQGFSEEEIDDMMAAEETAEELIEDSLPSEEDADLPPRVQQQVAGEEATDDEAAGLSGRVIELPVPEVGEIYVRIGEPGGGETDVETSYAPPTVVMPQGRAAQAAPRDTGTVGALSSEEISNIISEELRQAREEQALSREEISSIVEQTVQNELAAAGRAADVAARNEQIRQLEEQIDDLRVDLNEQLNDLERRQLEGRDRPVIVEEGEEGETRVVERGSARYDPSRLTPMAGFSFGGAGRFLIGVRGDYSGGYRRIRGAGFRFMPEAAIGLGEGVGINLIANGVYDFDEGFASRYLPSGVAPYAGLGMGLTTETGLGVNLLGGLEYTTRRGDIFLELSTMSFFDYNRMLIGYRVRL